MLRRIAVTFACLQALPLLLPAQAEPTPRPRIGLVLSGGGARGAAHAGVLEVLEQLRVPVDVVCGTSMGSIVGGLYAYGHTPDELAKLLARDGYEHDWSYMLQDGSGRAMLSYRRKDESRLFTGRLKFGLQGLSPQLPKGWIQGQNLETELRFLTVEAHDLDSFDELRLPFRCVAVDIGTGEQVVLDHGNLALAMRASMALPGVFAPAVVEGRELLDGGLVDNVPVDVARRLGCDVLIVVDIGTPLADKEKVRDLLDVTTQMVGILTQQNVDRSLQSLTARDVLIQPDLGSMTALSFERAADAIGLGREAAQAQAGKLRRYSVDEATWQQYLMRQRRVPSPVTIRKVTLDNHSSLGDAVIRSRIGAEPGEVLDEERLRAGLGRLYGSDDLQRIGFALHDRRDGSADLDVRAEDKSWGVDTLSFGLKLQSNFRDASDYELGMFYDKKYLNSLGAEWRTLFTIGSEQTIASEFYQPLTDGGTFFVAPGGFVGSTSGDIYSGSTKVAEGKVRYMMGSLDVGMELGHLGELRVGVMRARGSIDIDLSVLPFPIPKIDFDDGAYRAQLFLDTLDDAFFPRTGLLSTAEYRCGREELGSDGDYQMLALSHAQAMSWKALTAEARLALDATLDGPRPFYATPSLGGFLRISGLPAGSIGGQYMALGVLQLRQRLSRGLLPIYLGGSIEAGNVWASRSEMFDSWRIGGSLFVAVDTPVGPLHLGIGFAEAGDNQGFLFLGPPR